MQSVRCPPISVIQTMRMKKISDMSALKDLDYTNRGLISRMHEVFFYLLKNGARMIRELMHAVWPSQASRRRCSSLRKSCTILCCKRCSNGSGTRNTNVVSMMGAHPTCGENQGKPRVAATATTAKKNHLNPKTAATLIPYPHAKFSRSKVSTQSDLTRFSPHHHRGGSVSSPRLASPPRYGVFFCNVL